MEEKKEEMSEDAYQACAQLFQIIPDKVIKNKQYGNYLKSEEGRKFLKTLPNEEKRELTQCEDEEDLEKRMELYLSTLL